MTFDTGLLISKIIGSVFAGVYGFYATVTDFYKTEHGRKTLLRKGEVGLCLLLLATVINVVGDSIKQKRDLDTSRTESLRRDAETARILAINGQVDREVIVTAETSLALKNAVVVLSDTSKAVSENISETQRLLDPIQPSMYLEAYFSLPLANPKVRPYADRVQKPNVAIVPGEDDFPKENSNEEKAVYQFLMDSSIDLIFRKDMGTKTLVLSGRCQANKLDYSKVEIRFVTPNLQIVCRTYVHKGADDGSFRSYSDLLSADVIVRTSDYGIGAALNKVILEATLTEGVRTYTDRRFLLNHI